jgi:hypothetical protein
VLVLEHIMGVVEVVVLVVRFVLREENKISSNSEESAHEFHEFQESVLHFNDGTIVCFSIMEMLSCCWWCCWGMLLLLLLFLPAGEYMAVEEIITMSVLLVLIVPLLILEWELYDDEGDDVSHRVRS